MRLLIVDDHSIVRLALAQVFEDVFPGSIIQMAESGSEGLELCLRETYDVILLDISLSDMNGIEVLQQLKTVQPDTPVLVVSMHPVRQYAVRCFKNGAAGYVSKSQPVEDIIHAVKKLLKGQRYVSAEAAENLAECFSCDDGQLPPHERLSEREFVVLCYLGEGLRMGDIAEKMHISPKTVSTYRSRLLEKMHMSHTGELIAYAARNCSE